MHALTRTRNNVTDVANIHGKVRVESLQVALKLSGHPGGVNVLLNMAGIYKVKCTCMYTTLRVYTHKRSIEL
jgi:hypothetical protein